jgi:hypothetical protein
MGAAVSVEQPIRKISKLLGTFVWRAGESRARGYASLFLHPRVDGREIDGSRVSG